MKEPMVRYSETFFSFQGEGCFTGRASVWVRFFMCNLQCDGFGQLNPQDPTTYDLPYEHLDVSQYKTIEELPVFERGCDSSYSWSKKFKHLQRFTTVKDLCDSLETLMKARWNPDGRFVNDLTGNDCHLVFTGGEPMLNQKNILEILQEFRDRGNYPKNITVESNSTVALNPAGKEAVSLFVDEMDGSWFWSPSPKLFSVSGEPNEKAFKPYNIHEYFEHNPWGQLKFVINGSDASWLELEMKVAELRRIFQEAEWEYPSPEIYVMPLGGTLEGQKGLISGHQSEKEIIDEAMRRGYHVSPRTHVYVYGNVIGS